MKLNRDVDVTARNAVDIVGQLRNGYDGIWQFAREIERIYNSWAARLKTLIVKQQ
jgi:hypothetical protein